MWPLAVLNINEVAPLMGFSYEKMHGRFAGKKNTDRRGLAVLTRWP